MSFLKKIFKPKPGGTLVGNLLRAGLNTATSLGMPGASLVSKILPEAPPHLVEQAQMAVAQAAAIPATTPASAKEIAAQVKESLVAAGLTNVQASNVGATAFAAATAQPAQADQVLTAAADNPALMTNSFSPKDLKTILNGAVDGAKNGAVDAYLDNTEAGKQTKADAVDAQGQKIMPYALMAALGFIIYSSIKK